jgi:GPN-loop GTPase
VEEPVYVYAVGTAGSGKSAFTAAFHQWLYQHNVNAITVNLDPGAEALPYEPDVDVRDWIMLGDVMEEYKLGPNGAQVMAADLIALRMGDIKEVLSQYRPSYVLVDTPGQMELFVFREAGRVVMEHLAPGRSLVNFLVDPFIAKHASAFVSQLMLSATTNFRFQVPVLNVLSKQDLLKDEELERINAWGEDPFLLQDALTAEKADLYNQMSTDLQRLLEGLGVSPRVTPTSAETQQGLEDVYGLVQDLFAGGEDEQSGVEPGERRL